LATDLLTPEVTLLLSEKGACHGGKESQQEASEGQESGAQETIDGHQMGRKSRLMGVNAISWAHDD
jgi:hypothetical protein